MGFDAFDRFFPNQDIISVGGFGKLTHSRLLFRLSLLPGSVSFLPLYLGSGIASYWQRCLPP